MYFSKDWLALVELSFRNFLAEAIEHLPLPTLLRFDTDRLQRSSLQKQVERLQTETAGLKQQLASFSKGSTAASDQQGTQQSQQHQQPTSGTRQLRKSCDSQFVDSAQHRFRPAQEGKAAAPPIAPKHDLQRQKDSSKASNSGSAANISQWVLADGQEQDQFPTANELAAEGSPDSRQHLHPQAGVHIKPSWSASLASLASSVLADSESGTPQQQASAEGEQLSLDADANSLHSLESETQLSSQAGSLDVTTEEGHALCGTPGSGQCSLADGKQQTLARLQPQLNDAETNKDSQSHDQQGSEAVTLPRQTDSGSECMANSQKDPTAEQLAGHDDGVTCCSFSPNGQNLATASTDGVVRISAPASLQVQPSLLAKRHTTCPFCVCSHFLACMCCVP